MPLPKKSITTGNRPRLIKKVGQKSYELTASSNTRRNKSIQEVMDSLIRNKNKK